MLPHINLYNLLFIDIETVPEYSSFSEMSDTMKELWAIKHQALRIENQTPEESYLQRAGVFAEFAKVICISLGYFYPGKDKSSRVLRLKSISGNEEKELLNEFVGLIRKSFSDPERFHFCGHNIREFDVPFLCRRMLKHRIELPDSLDRSGKRPWETEDVDTLQLWKFGDYKHYTSLKLLAEVLGLPSPKDEIGGKDVCRVYWQEKQLARIVEYCQKDVVTVARLLLRFKGDMEPLTESHIVITQ